MKHLKHLFTAMLLLCTTFATAHDFEVDGIYYNVTNAINKTVEVTSGTDKYTGSVVIPLSVTYKGTTYSVTTIGNEAFSGCSGLTSVTIPNSVTSIGYRAFYKCSGLTSVTIPNSVTSIGNSAFSYCSGLESITISNSVTSIGNWAFSDCSGLTSITISNSVTSIGNWAFQNCSGLTSITIPNSVTSIGERAFDSCYGLTSVTIPNSVTSIGGGAFYNCYSLTNITIPNSVTSIEGSAFSGCFGLTSVTIPNGVTSIGYSAFLDCSGLTSVTIPNSVTSIGNSAFRGCTGLTSVTIPNSVTSIGGGAFRGCTGLTSITIPNSVTSIGEMAFYYCSGLTSITIGNGVTSIGYSAFLDCSGLTSVTIGDGVTSIGEKAFYYCTRIKEIYVKAKTPPTVVSDAFYDVPTASATLYVPYGTKSAYQAADVWKNFTNIVEIKQVEHVTEVTINVDESGYAIYCSEYALDFSEIDDVKVYAATGYKSDTQVVTLARVMTTAAETGIFIKGEPGEYVVPVIDECSEHSLNLFVGTFVETTVNSTSGGKYNFNFKVNNDDSAPMFYPFEDSTIFGANKAYLQIPSEWLDTNASKSISIMFDDEEANGLKGDINGDGRVSVTDIQSVVNIILNVE